MAPANNSIGADLSEGHLSADGRKMVPPRHISAPPDRLVTSAAAVKDHIAKIMTFGRQGPSDSRSDPPPQDDDEVVMLEAGLGRFVTRVTGMYSPSFYYHALLYL
jgi:hypothetical protein